MSDERPVWAWVAHKPKRFGGAITPACGGRDIRSFCGEMASNGYTVTPVYDRPEYEALLATIKESP